LITWSNLTALRAVAKTHGVVRPNTKQIPELLEELARLDIAVSEVCEEEMEVAVGPVEPEAVGTVKESLTVEASAEKVTEEGEIAAEKVTEDEVFETPVAKIKRLSKHVSDVSEQLKKASKDLAKATNDEFRSRAKPKTHAQLLKEQREQDAKARENTKTVNAVAQAQKNFLAGRAQDARENMKQIMAEQLKKRG